LIVVVKLQFCHLSNGDNKSACLNKIIAYIKLRSPGFSQPQLMTPYVTYIIKLLTGRNPILGSRIAWITLQ